MRQWMLLAALPLAACGAFASDSDSGTKANPSGSGGTRSFDASGFSSVDLRGADDVVVTVGPAFAVRAEGPAEELDRLDIRVDGGTLRVGRELTSGWLSSHRGVKVHVSMPSIDGASVSGSGDMTIDRAQGERFHGAVAGSGDLSIAALTTRQARLSVAGSGDVAAKGSVGSLKVSVAGSGAVDASALKATSADVSIAGSGDVSADVDGPAKVSIAGSGDANLGPRARCSTSKVGSGSAHCG